LDNPQPFLYIYLQIYKVLIFKEGGWFMYIIKYSVGVVVNGYKTNYNISTRGEVVNHITKQILKPCIGGKGYLYINLSIDGVKIKRTLHRLLAEHFIPNPKLLPVVNHKNGDKMDNALYNLEWMTYSENNIHAYDTNLNIHKGINSHFNKYSEDLIFSICKEIESGTNLRDIPNKLNVKFHLVSDVYYRFRWRHLTVNCKFINNYIVNTDTKPYRKLRDRIHDCISKGLNNNDIITDLKLHNFSYIEDTLNFFRYKSGSTTRA
jgi:hypothetical protein